MIELTNIEHTLEAKLHAILHELEAKLQTAFGSYPYIAEHFSIARAKLSAELAPGIEAQRAGPPSPNPTDTADGAETSHIAIADSDTSSAVDPSADHRERYIEPGSGDPATNLTT